MPEFSEEEVTAITRLFHENYERLAPEHGYSTREASAVPWEDVPPNNRSLMIATVRAVLVASGAVPRAEYEQLRDELASMADAHHRTLTGSRRHDPANTPSFRDCECHTCQRAAAVLDGRETGPDRAWKIVEHAEAELERVKAALTDARESFQAIRYAYFPADEKARLAWATQTFRMARAAVDAIDALQSGAQRSPQAVDVSGASGVGGSR